MKSQCQWTHPEVKWTPEGVLGYLERCSDRPRYARIILDPPAVDPGTGEPLQRMPTTIAIMAYQGHTSVMGDPRHFGWREVDCTDVPVITRDAKTGNFEGIMGGGLLPGGPASKQFSWKKASWKGRRSHDKGKDDVRWGLFCSPVDAHGLWPNLSVLDGVHLGPYKFEKH